MVSNRAEPLDRTFSALADPTRRALLVALAEGPRTVGELAAPLPISLVAVTKHLAVLERADLIRRSRRGRSVDCRLHDAPLTDAADWITAYQRSWHERLDRLSAYLRDSP